MVVTTIVLENSQLAKDLERVTFELKNRKIPVKFIRDFSGFSFEGITILPATKGSHVEIPYFIAEFLQSQLIIEEFKDDFPASLMDLTNIVRNEVRSGKIQPLNPFFNIIIKEQMFLEGNLDEGSQFDQVELSRKKSKFNQLIHERTTKIVKMAETGNPMLKKTDLTPTEEILYKKLIELVQSWKTEFIQKIG